MATSDYQRYQESQRAAKEIMKDIRNQEKGDPELAQKTVDLVSRVFPSPEQAERAFQMIGRVLDAPMPAGNHFEEIGKRWKKILETADRSYGPGAQDMLNDLARRYMKDQARVASLKPPQAIYELFTSPILTSQMKDLWPKQKQRRAS